MDIIDIMLARAMTPQGKTEAYVAKAEKAAQKATAAEASATAAIQTVEEAADEIATAREEAASLLEEAQEALETAQSAQINTLSIEDVDEEIGKLDVSVNLVQGTNSNTYQVITSYPDNTIHTETATKLYKSTGDSEDGTMTQKAISVALATKVESSTLDSYASKQYVDTAIAQNPGGGGGSFNFTTDDAGHIIVIDENGNVIAGAVTENALINALLDSNTFSAKNAVGLDMNYAEKTFARIQEAYGKTMGSDFDSYPMYGGRMKCNVADDGTINAFYGDQNYTEDGSNGQVMIYQPKFYYRRTPYTVDGNIIRHESLMISAENQVGFKLAPAFEGDLEYILLPAYEGSLQNSKLASIAGVLPATNITIEQAENYATARGDGWHIINLAAEATNQMLEMVEFGTMNGQLAIESGITLSLPNNAKGLFITGSTASLGNGTGHAESSSVDINGTITSYSDIGHRAIAYRGLENPWGHIWQFIGGVNILGSTAQNGGTPYICKNFNYTPTTITGDYESIEFVLPSQGQKWINAMGIGNKKYDWAFIPAECSSSASSLAPIGDAIWSTTGVNGIRIMATGGSYGYEEECGPFYYATDHNLGNSAAYKYGAKLLYIPTKNATYTANIAKWQAKMGG